MDNWREKEKMTSKERVMRTFEHREVDRVPIDYSANPEIDRKLKQHFNLKSNDKLQLYDMLGVDFARISAKYVGPNLDPELPELKVDQKLGVRTRWVEHSSGGYWEPCDFPLQGANEEEVASWPLPSPDDFDYSHIEEFCKENKKFAIQCGSSSIGCVINTLGSLMGMEDILVGLITEDPSIMLLADRINKLNLEVMKRTIEASKGGIDFMKMGEDLGTQHAPLINPELYRAVLYPIHKKFVDLAAHYGLPTMFHSCGSSSWAFEDFIKMGIKMIDTLQPEAANMSPTYLKEYFGGRLAFHGCISTAGPLSFGTVSDVKNIVKETLSVMKPGGGYCLAPTHKIQDNTPLENVLAMYATAHKLGWYE